MMEGDSYMANDGMKVTSLKANNARAQTAHFIAIERLKTTTTTMIAIIATDLSLCAGADVFRN